MLTTIGVDSTHALQHAIREPIFGFKDLPVHKLQTDHLGVEKPQKRKTKRLRREKTKKSSRSAAKDSHKNVSFDL